MELFHILTRGVDGREIFLDEQDNFRFVHDLYEFNDEEPVNTSFYAFQQSYDVRHRDIGKEEKRERKLLVNIHAFAIMKTHYHLLISSLEKVENAIPLFIKKLNGGYARYFNQKYKRKGHLFEGKYKSIHVVDESHFLHLPFYIHCNRLDTYMPEWRTRELRHPEKAIKFLNEDRWSSHFDYLGKKNFPSVTQREFLLDFFGSEEGYRKSMEKWIRDDAARRDVSQEIALEPIPILRRQTS